MKRLQEKYIGELIMKKLLNFKNSIIMIIGSLLCLSGLIGCSSTSVSNGVGQALNIIEQVTDSSNKNNIVLNNPTENTCLFWK